MLVKEVLCFAAYDTLFSPSYFCGIKLIVSLEGSFSGVVNGEHLQHLTCLILNRNVTHSLAVSARVLIYYVDYHSPLEPVLLAQLAGRDWIEHVQLPERLSMLATWRPPASQTGELAHLADLLLVSLFPQPVLPMPPAGHWQVEPILHYIDAHIREVITLADLAPLLLLSVDRTRHLFIEQVGMPFSQYMIWMRLKLVVHATLTQLQPLGELATYYGFADPSHFQRLFKRTFGMSPNQLRKRRGQHLFLAR